MTDMATPTATVGLPALTALRRSRRRKRIAQFDRFEAAYRVYLAGILSSVAVIAVTGWVGGEPVSDNDLGAILRRGPAVIGLFAALAIAMGLRSGSRGGPIALEVAEVRHVLLAPVDRRRALVPFAVRSIRSAVFSGVAAGAAAGVLADRRMPHQRIAWGGAGALTGVTIALLYVGSALVASGIRLKRLIASVLALVVVGGAVADVAGKLPWPTSAAGSLALWPLRTRPLDLLLPVVGLVAAAIGPSLLGRLSLNDAERRTALVGQMRMAVTFQDVRSVLVLRRQLVAERPRSRPWFKLPKWAGRSPWWRRGWQSALRTPLSRLARTLVLLTGGAALAVPAMRGTPALVLVAGMVAYLVGLDLVEPLAQSVEYSDRSDQFPVDTGLQHLRLMSAPIAVALINAAVAAALAQLVAGTSTERLAVIVSAFTLALSGLAGAATSVIMGAPTGPSAAASMLPPEIAGARLVGRAVWPVILACTGALPALIAWRATEANAGGVKNAVVLASMLRGALAAILAVVGVLAWVKNRAAARVWWAQQMELSKATQKERQSRGSSK
jgi:hypothetical protein